MTARYLRAGLAGAILVSAAIPALAVDDAVIKSKTTKRLVKDGKLGTQTTTRTQVYRWVSDNPNVVAIYRGAFRSWLDNMSEQRIGYEGGTGGYNAGLVEQALGKVGWDNMLDYVWNNVGPNSEWAYRSKGQFGSLGALKAAANTSERYDWSWGWSDSMILIDLDKTGTDAILGSVRVGGYSENYSKYYTELAGGTWGAWGWDKSDLGTRDTSGATNVRTLSLRSGETVTVDIKGMVYTVSPILLDLAGEGKPDLLAPTPWAYLPGRRLASAALRQFDLDGSGPGMAWEWVGPRSGLLVWDPHGKGKIASGRQLFGNVTWGKRWKDGYQALATLDANRDGRLAGAELAKLAVWKDADSDAVSDAGEVKPLSAHGIVSLAVKPQRDKLGNTWKKGGFARRQLGGKEVASDTWDWIALGSLRTAGGTYVWVGQYAKQQLGGYFHLRNLRGRIEGVTIPTVGTTPVKQNTLAAFPIKGTAGPKFYKWQTPAPRGSKVESEVVLLEGGKRLSGKTVVTTPEKSWSYDWQAQLIAGRPLGDPAVR